MENAAGSSADSVFTSPLDVDFIRAQFPANHWAWAFFENAGGAYVPYTVIDRITTYMTENQVQPGYPFPESTQAMTRMDLGHRLMAELIGAQTDEVTIAASTSINVYVLAQALRGQWQAGDYQRRICVRRLPG